jgi:hypothetical protein
VRRGRAAAEPAATDATPSRRVLRLRPLGDASSGSNIVAAAPGSGSKAVAAAPSSGRKTAVAAPGSGRQLRRARGVAWTGFSKGEREVGALRVLSSKLNLKTYEKIGFNAGDVGYLVLNAVDGRCKRSQKLLEALAKPSGPCIVTPAWVRKSADSGTLCEPDEFVPDVEYTAERAQEAASMRTILGRRAKLVHGVLPGSASCWTPLSTRTSERRSRTQARRCSSACWQLQPRPARGAATWLVRAPGLAGPLPGAGARLPPPSPDAPPRASRVSSLLSPLARPHEEQEVQAVKLAAPCGAATCAAAAACGVRVQWPPPPIQPLPFVDFPSNLRAFLAGKAAGSSAAADARAPGGGAR